MAELQGASEEEEQAAAPAEAEETSLAVQGGLNGRREWGEKVRPLEDANETSKETNVDRDGDMDEIYVDEPFHRIEDRRHDHSNASQECENAKGERADLGHFNDLAGRAGGVSDSILGVGRRGGRGLPFEGVFGACFGHGLRVFFETQC